MAITITKADPHGAYRMIAEHDLYLDESGTKVIVVKDGEEVPKEAATVLAGKGGTIPARYADMLKALDAPAEVKGEVREEVKEGEVKGEVKVKPETQPTAPAAEPKVKPKPEPVKLKPVEEKPAE